MRKADRDALLARIRATDWEASNEGVCKLVAREVDRAVRRERARPLVLGICFDCCSEMLHGVDNPLLCKQCMQRRGGW